MLHDDLKIVRKKMVITGRVQGVGFRYRAKYAALSCGLTGWVRNEWDGSVHMEVQGTERQIAEMFRMITESKYIYITGMETKEIPVKTSDTGFHAR